MKYSNCVFNALLMMMLLTSFGGIAQERSALKPTGLSCEYSQEPIGIETLRPRFSWLFKPGGRDQFQSAYEIIVGEERSLVESGRGSLWETGKVMSGENIQVEYAGKALQPRTRYYWRVRVFDQQGQGSGWSEASFFETGMMDASGWKAGWIGDGSRLPERDADYYKEDPMPLFRKDFVSGKKVKAARLYISGLGYYEAWLNGRKISDHVLEPGFTSYKKQVLYNVYDVTAMVRKGRNVAGIMLGNGWWNPLPMKLFGRFEFNKHQQTGRPCVRAEIHIKYTDGTEDLIKTDESWRTTAGPVVKNSVYLGERYDARKEVAKWNAGTERVGIWKRASIVEGPAGAMSAQGIAPVRITRVVRPIGISEERPDTFIVDMGQNFAGVARIHVKGPAGREVHLRYGEELFKDGRLNVMTTVCTQIKQKGMGGEGAPDIAWQEDDYVLNGGGTEIWSPRFTFHGFRYIEITGWPGKPRLEDIEGLRMNSDVGGRGEFSCSNPMLNKLHEAIQWTFLSNIFSVQSDCPAREKMGYGADIVVTANSFMYNYDMAQFYSKTVKDYANDQQADGAITEIAPYTGIADKGYGGESGPLGWELVFPYLQKQLYEFYGDKRNIEENYEAVKRQLKFLEGKAVDQLFYRDISDHEALDTKPEAFTASAFYYHHAVLAAEFAGILGKGPDSIHYRDLATAIRSSIVEHYQVGHSGRFDNATQSAQLFALWYGFAGDRDSVFKRLKEEFVRHDWHLSTGIFSTRMLFDVFREAGMNELAYKVATQPDYPGWFNMLSHGATTLWECWGFPGTVYSENHPMFGSIEEWFYRSLLGINAGSPGFRTIVVRPQPAGDLTYAKGSYQSVRGKIVSEWRKTGNEFELVTRIPSNTNARICIPAGKETILTESGQPVKDAVYEEGYFVVERGSGDYIFKAVR